MQLFFYLKDIILPLRNRVLFVISQSVVVVIFTVLPAYAQISADWSAGGAVVIGPSATMCDGTIEGAIRWSDSSNTIEMCDGFDWKKIVASSDTGTPSTPPSSAGYFVLTSGSWDGDLKTAGSGTTGFDGANSLCLNDLTNNDWMGKSDAQARSILNSSHVRAFLCYGDNNTTTGTGPYVCQNPLASTEYYFAVSGDNTKGGASFTADGNGSGPANTQNWSGTNYFASDTQIWTGRGSYSASLWHIGGETWNSPACDVAWDGYGTPGDNQNPDYARYGSTNNNDQKRWVFGIQSCASVSKLICMVHP